MDPERWRKIEALYEAARGVDAARRAVESLLAHGENAGRFLEVPAVEMLPEAARPAVGQRISHYEIQEKLGEGGMGVVYRAYDTQLRRPVAFKVLSPECASDPERRERLLREARVASALNHPNIVGIHEVGSDHGVDFIAMEFVEGKSMGEIIPAKGLPLGRALDYAVQIASGLARANAAGVVHRDLKPGNIMLTPDGLVKLLDFGLARHVELGEGHETTLTVEGEILGTPSYMSPEQAQGKPVDVRSDVFSFGSVLYQVVTGYRAFEKNSNIATLAAVIEQEPRPLPSGVPHDLRRIIARCLRKNPAHRFQHMDDVKVELEELKEESDSGRLVATAEGPSRRARRWLLATASAVLLAAVMFLVYLRESPPGTPTLRYTIPIPGKLDVQSFALSPDGRHLAIAASAEYKSPLWVHTLDTMQVRALEETEEAQYPFWSPDSQFIGFFARGKLMKIGLSGDGLQPLCAAPDGRGASWGRQGLIVFAPTPDGGLQRVSAAGGLPAPLTKPETSTTHRFPVLLSDGRRFLYTVSLDFEASRRLRRFRDEASPGGAEKTGIYVGSIDSRESRRVLTESSSAVYVASPPGDRGAYVLWGRGSTLMAQPVDSGHPRSNGNAFPVVGDLHSGANVGFGPFSVSQNGILVYQRSRDRRGSEAQFIWFDRSGLELGRIGEMNTNAGSFALSPDDRRVVISRRVPSQQSFQRTPLLSDLWMRDLERGTASRFTFNDSYNDTPLWSPDGNRVVFVSSRDNRFGLYRRASNGAGQDELLFTFNGPVSLTDWSRNGRYLVYVSRHGETLYDLFVLTLDGDGRIAGGPAPLLQTVFDETQGQISPDGMWLAYTSNESRENEVYVRPFLPNAPGAGGKWQVSTAGGTQPRWRRDGKELFYLATDRSLMSVPVRSPDSSGLR